jgi:RHS repeat-associated protein
VTRAGFTGHQHDNDLGLIDMRGRIYDPLAARFTSADPFLLAPYSTQGLNRYSYVFNDPVNSIDPSGYISEELNRGLFFASAVTMMFVAPYAYKYAATIGLRGAGPAGAGFVETLLRDVLGRTKEQQQHWRQKFKDAVADFRRTRNSRPLDESVVEMRPSREAPIDDAKSLDNWAEKHGKEAKDAWNEIGLGEALPGAVRIPIQGVNPNKKGSVEADPDRFAVHFGKNPPKQLNHSHKRGSPHASSEDGASFQEKNELLRQHGVKHTYTIGTYWTADGRKNLLWAEWGADGELDVFQTFLP